MPRCLACSLPITIDQQGTLIDSTGGDCCFDNEPHQIVLNGHYYYVKSMFYDEWIPALASVDDDSVYFRLMHGWGELGQEIEFVGPEVPNFDGKKIQISS